MTFGNAPISMVASASDAWWATVLTMPSISSRSSIRSGLNSRRPSRVRLRIAVIRRSILAIDDLMKPSDSLKSSDSCLSEPSSSGSATSVASSGIAGASDAVRLRVAMRLKMSPRNSSSSLVKPMMLTSGERRSWLTI